MTNRIVLLCLLLSTFPLLLQAQQPSYKDMMYDRSYNVYEVIEAAEAYFEENGKGKGSGYKGYERWRELIEPMFYPSGDRRDFNPDQLRQEMARVQAEQIAQRTAAAPGEHWRFLGPTYANNLLPASYASGVGRVETSWAGFASPDTILLGARNGGFWKTTNGGTNWRSTTQDLAAVGVRDIEVNPFDHNEVWIITQHATGYSTGLLKSTDFGESWNATGFSITGYYDILSDLFIAPNNPDTMYLTGSSGFWRSVDGGNTWSNTFTDIVRGMAVNPANSQQVYLVVNAARNDVRISYDGGSTWPGTTTIPANNNSSPRLRTSADRPSALYFASNQGIWKSDDYGLSFTQTGNSPASIMEFGVSDTDHNLCFFGSLDQFMSTDGGQSWTLFAPWVNSTAPNYIHADGRSLRSFGGILYFGTDGYLGRSTDNGATWHQVNNAGTGLREFYRIGTSPSRTDMLVGGSQDNGTSVLIDSLWYEWFGGDGMDCHFNWTIPDIWYGNWQYGGMRKTTNFGQNTQGIKPSTSNGDWVTPTVLDRNNESSLFAAFDTLFKSTDHGDTWTALEGFSFLGNVRQMAMSTSDSNYIYLCRNSRFFASSDNGQNWTEHSAGLPGQAINRIAVHPSDPQRVAIVLSNFNPGHKVYESTDMGQTWVNTSGALPDIPATCAVWQEGPQDRLWVGMDGGVWYKDNASPWTLYADSLPVQPLRDLEILHGANTIRAGVFGRGAWEAPLPGTVGAPRIVRMDIDPGVNPFNKPNNQDDVHVEAAVTSPDPLSTVQLLWGLDGITFPNAAPMALQSGNTYRTTAPIPPHPTGQQVYFRVRAEDVDGDTARTEKIVYRVKEAVLCTGEGSPGTGSDWISSVKLNTINNTSNQTFYSDFSASQTTTLQAGMTYTVEVGLNTFFSCDSVFGWIDYDDDFIFEPSEQLVFGQSNAFNVAAATFTVPSSVASGTVVMRVRNIYDCNGAQSDPCNVYAGEVEDYGIVLDGLVSAAAPLPTLEVYPNPARERLAISGPGLEGDWKVYDMKGVQMPVRWERDGDRLLADLSQLAAGAYLLVGKQQGRSVNRKFTVER